MFMVKHHHHHHYYYHQKQHRLLFKKIIPYSQNTTSCTVIVIIKSSQMYCTASYVFLFIHKIINQKGRPGFIVDFIHNLNEMLSVDYEARFSLIRLINSGWSSRQCVANFKHDWAFILNSSTNQISNNFNFKDKLSN